LKELGVVRGRDFILEDRWARNDLERLPALAEEVIATKPDLIIVISTPATLAITRATKTIPIVFVNVSNPLDLGIVKSLRQPGGNTTGVSNIGDQMMPKLLEVGLTLMPTVSRTGVLVNPSDPTAN
jgi:putative ABC transport system substrate-binding protein